MKKLIIFSGALMGTALVCGAFDFAGEMRYGALAKLYSEKQTELIASIQKKADALPKKKAVAVKSEVTSAALVASGVKNEPTKTPVVKKAKKKKKISYENFSRGSMNEKHMLAMEKRRMEKAAKLEAEKAEKEKAALESTAIVMAADSTLEK